MNAPSSPVKFSRSELHVLVWQESLSRLAARFGLSDVGLAKICRRHKIPTPPVGYWARKRAGQLAPGKPLPKLSREEPITLAVTKKKERAVSPQERVSDEKLKRLIAFEEQPENRILVRTDPVKQHRFVEITRESIARGRVGQRDLCLPIRSQRGPCLEIAVSNGSVSRALRLMNALIQSLEGRGHKITSEVLDNWPYAVFVVLGEQFCVRVLENTTIAHVPESQRPSRHSNRIRHNPTGRFELRLRPWRQRHETIWRDGRKGRVEDQLNSVIIEMLVGAEAERNRRRAIAKRERMQRKAEARRLREEERKQLELRRIAGLHHKARNWARAARLRAFLAEWQSQVEQQEGPIQEGSEAHKWLEWATLQADSIDPLRTQIRKQKPRAK